MSSTQPRQRQGRRSARRTGRAHTGRGSSVRRISRRLNSFAVELLTFEAKLRHTAFHKALLRFPVACSSSTTSSSSAMRYFSCRRRACTHANAHHSQAANAAWRLADWQLARAGRLAAPSRARRAAGRRVRTRRGCATTRGRKTAKQRQHFPSKTADCWPAAQLSCSALTTSSFSSPPASGSSARSRSLRPPALPMPKLLPARPPLVPPTRFSARRRLRVKGR